MTRLMRFPHRHPTGDRTMARQFRTITVEHLRELLEDQADEALVIFTTDYGDHSHTPQALPLEGEIEEVTISESAYSNSRWAIDEDDDEDQEEAKQKYLVIR